MPVDTVLALKTAFTILRSIRSTVQLINASKEQLRLLSAFTMELLTTLNTEFRESRLVPDKFAKALTDLEMLLHDIHRFVEIEKESGFLKMLIQKDTRFSKIEAFYKRIGMTIAAFQIVSLLNI
ncbi:hypothetical protein B0H19DRAFT_154718 [Mycena capillaripes]|nr:hypothetical protein B0H19DRAFT_154718 [Mycena capillaripes]